MHLMLRGQLHASRLLAIQTTKKRVCSAFMENIFPNEVIYFPGLKTYFLQPQLVRIIRTDRTQTEGF